MDRTFNGKEKLQQLQQRQRSPAVHPHWQVQVGYCGTHPSNRHFDGHTKSFSQQWSPNEKELVEMTGIFLAYLSIKARGYVQMDQLMESYFEKDNNDIQ